MNAFTKALQSHDARTKNDALSHSTSDSALLDYFAKVGSYRGRPESEVNASMASIFADDMSLALKMVFYNRLITRKPKSYNVVARGQGNKDEFIKSVKWLEHNYPKLLYKNLWLIPVVGCWKDLWYDSATGFYHYIEFEEVARLVKAGLANDYYRPLIAKYLPQIKSRSKQTNERLKRQSRFARRLAAYLGWSERDYRKFKASPENTAHKFQRDMCSNRWDALNFDHIPGKALFNLLRTGKDKQTSLARHSIEGKYVDWIKSKPVANFSGYVYELYAAAKKRSGIAQKYTYDAQFRKLLEVARQDINPTLLEKGVLCALDTSGSMECEVAGKVQAVDICVSLGIFFSSFLKGEFADTVVMFDSQSRTLKLKGEFCDKVDQIKGQAVAWGSTNFQSVIDEIVRVRTQRPDIPLEDYPKVLLVVSDMQHNPAERGMVGNEQTNYEAAMNKLAAVGLPKMSIIWWQVSGRYASDVPNKMDDEGVVLISGFDPSIVTSILGGEKKVVDERTGEIKTVQLTPYEQMVKALDQEVLNQLTV